MSYIRPISVTTGPVRTEGTVVHLGSRVAASEARLVGRDDGKLYAHATTTCLILG